MSKDQRVCGSIRLSTLPVGGPFQRSLADAGIITPREKKLRRDKFDLSGAVHNAEFTLLQKPLDPATQQLVQPDHKFDVTLEPDKFTEEKWVISWKAEAVLS